MTVTEQEQPVVKAEVPAKKEEAQFGGKVSFWETRSHSANDRFFNTKKLDNEDDDDDVERTGTMAKSMSMTGNGKTNNMTLPRQRALSSIGFTNKQKTEAQRAAKKKNGFASLFRKKKKVPAS